MFLPNQEHLNKTKLEKFLKKTKNTKATIKPILNKESLNLVN